MRGTEKNVLSLCSLRFFVARRSGRAWISRNPPPKPSPSPKKARFRHVAVADLINRGERERFSGSIRASRVVSDALVADSGKWVQRRCARSPKQEAARLGAINCKKRTVWTPKIAPYRRLYNPISPYRTLKKHGWGGPVAPSCPPPALTKADLSRRLVRRSFNEGGSFGEGGLVAPSCPP